MRVLRALPNRRSMPAPHWSRPRDANRCGGGGTLGVPPFFVSAETGRAAPGRSAGIRMEEPAPGRRCRGIGRHRMRVRRRSGRWFVCLSEMGGDRKAVGRGSCGGGAAPVVCVVVHATGETEVRAGMCPSPVAGVRCGGRKDGRTEGRKDGRTEGGGTARADKKNRTNRPTPESRRFVRLRLRHPDGCPIQLPDRPASQRAVRYLTAFTIASKAWGSFIARSASTLRLSWSPLALILPMNSE